MHYIGDFSRQVFGPYLGTEFSIYSLYKYTFFFPVKINLITNFRYIWGHLQRERTENTYNRDKHGIRDFMQSSVDLLFFFLCVFEILLCCGMKKHLLILWHCFSWIQNRHKILVVGGRPVGRSVMSVTLVQSIKCSEFKGNFYSIEKCCLSIVRIPTPVFQIETVYYSFVFLKKVFCLTVNRPVDQPCQWLLPPEHWCRCIHWISYKSIVSQRKRKSIPKSPPNCRM